MLGRRADIIAPPPYDTRPRRHSFSGMSNADMTGGSRNVPLIVPTVRDRSFFGKLKERYQDRNTRVKEEKEAERRRMIEVRP
jgi:hypothetical protein